VALLGVGVIVGLEVAALVFAGGAIGWIVSIPLYYAANPLPDGDVLDAAWAAWSGQIRYMGVGAMIVGGLWSMVRIRSGIMKGVREAFSGFRSQASAARDRTDQDLPTSVTAVILLLAGLATIGLYPVVTGSISVALVAGVVMVIASFFFVAVSSYIVGLVGSANNPISGLTICALIFSSIVLLLLGMTGTTGIHPRENAPMGTSIARVASRLTSTPPSRPSQVLPGLMCGASLRRPKRRPAK
jgi:putative OPT family oligopeptide transporter